jgi:hypothetical protein
MRCAVFWQKNRQDGAALSNQQVKRMLSPAWRFTRTGLRFPDGSLILL